MFRKSVLTATTAALLIVSQVVGAQDLLGHTQVEITARYAHLAWDSVRESAIRISDSIAADILKEYIEKDDARA